MPGDSSRKICRCFQYFCIEKNAHICYNSLILQKRKEAAVMCCNSWFQSLCAMLRNICGGCC